MNDINIMKQALGGQWEMLPASLKAHYQSAPNTDIGQLDIEYPTYMQWFLNLLHMFGALINRQGKEIPSRVEKHMRGKIQYWRRQISFPDGSIVLFTSRWKYLKENRLIEYVNPVLGLCMAVSVKDGVLYYEGKYYVVNLGLIEMPLPEWLLLGHTTIRESQLSVNSFKMDFRLRHPFFGQIYRYAGVFAVSDGIGA